MTKLTLIIICIVSGVSGFLVGACSLLVNGYFDDAFNKLFKNAQNDKHPIEKKKRKHEHIHKVLLAIFGTLEKTGGDEHI